jgi:hypothetical protein
MIEAKDAAYSAARYFTDITGYTEKVTIEEVEFDDNTNCWLITVGYLAESEIIPLVKRQKEYKVFKIDANNGDVLSMKMRN